MTVLLIILVAFTNLAIGFAISRIFGGTAAPAVPPAGREAAVPAGQPVVQDVAGGSGPSPPDPQARCAVSTMLSGLRDAIPRMKAALSQELSDPYFSIKENHLTAVAQMSSQLLGAPDDFSHDSDAFTFKLDQLKAQFESSLSNLAVIDKRSSAKTTSDAALSELEKIESLLKMFNPCNSRPGSSK